MSTSKQPPRRVLLSAEPLSRPAHGHLPSDAEPLAERHDINVVDPHTAWLRKWRCLRTDIGVDDDSDRARELVSELQAKIAHTPAETLAGMQAQAFVSRDVVYELA
jgi:hypothetical protein